MSRKCYIVSRPVHGAENFRVYASSKREAMNKVNEGAGTSMNIDIYKTSKATFASPVKTRAVLKSGDEL